MIQSTHTESPAETLARSAFGFAIAALLPAIGTWVALLLSSPSPDPLFEKIRLGIIIGFGLAVLILLWATIRLYQVAPEDLLPAAQRIASVLGHSWVAAFLSATTLEFNILAFQTLTNVAPAITNPGKFLLICWSLLLTGIIVTVNRPSVAAWLKKTSTLWSATGLSVFTSIIITLFIVINAIVIDQTGIADRLRGGLDYRELSFFDDGEPPPTPENFWKEQAQTRVRWSPYTYWVLDEFHGTYINIDQRGIRFTPDYAAGDATTIYVFGGSTVWGEGSRDPYTIPGHIARLLSEHGIPQHVTNYGQTGYVSTQDVIWFQLQLMSGNIPDVAVFYQGFNDVLSAWGQNQSGITLQENMRLNDAEAGRILRGGRPVLRLPDTSLEQYDLSLAGVGNASAQAIAERWLANVSLVQAMADAYGVQVYFVWQPAIMFKNHLTDSEQAIYERWENERPGLFELYRAVDTIIRQHVNKYDNILVLSDLFYDNEQAIFHDLVHITEIGNGIVAEALIPELIAMLDT